MKFIEQYFHCGDHLRETFAEQVGGIIESTVEFLVRRRQEQG